jgi:hypothetical protein
MGNPTGNVFDNSAAVTPSLEGQVTPSAEGTTGGQTPQNTDGQVAAASTSGTPANAGQAPEGQTQGQSATAGWQSEFKSPEELYEAYTKNKQSYDNLRPAYTKATTELSALRKSSTTQQPAAQQAGSTQNLDASQTIKDRVVSIVAPLQEKQEELSMQTTLQGLAQKNPEVFQKVIPDVQKIFEERPELWNMPHAIETVYDIAEARYIKQNIATIANDATSKAYADKAIKTLTGEN